HEGELTSDLGSGRGGNLAALEGAVLSVEDQLPPVHSTQAIDVREVGLGPVLGSLEQPWDRRRKVVHLADGHGVGGDPGRGARTTARAGPGRRDRGGAR